MASDIAMDQNLTMDGRLSTGEFISAQTTFKIKSDGTGSHDHVHLCGSGNAYNTHSDVNICTTGGVANTDTQGHLWVNAQDRLHHSGWWFTEY